MRLWNFGQNGAIAKEFHHDLRFEIEGVRVYIETRLSYRLPID